MRRVTRHACEDGPVLEEQETEGQRQLHNLLLQQLDTDVDFDRCLAKRRCFAPSAMYKPFGDQAVGVRSLSQFRALQDGEKELDSLRELGLTDTEIQLWRSRDAPGAAEKVHGVCVAPSVREQRLQVIRDKMGARVELLARPQRFTTSRPLSRREMEIERALFHGSDRLDFLTALYHREEDEQERQQRASSSDPMDSLYRDVLSEGRKHSSPQDSEGETTVATHPLHPPPESVPHPSQSLKKNSDLSQSSQKYTDQSQSSQKEIGQSQEQGGCQSEPLGGKNRLSGQSELNLTTSDQVHPQNRPEHQRLAAPKRINVSEPIGSLCGAVKVGIGGPLTVRGEIEDIPDEEILKNRESEEGIRNIPRFRNYQPGEPSKVLCVKNLSAQASVAQLVSLFSRFEPQGGPPILYRLLTGRLKGQAFITLSDEETSQKALELVHGYRLLGKPLVIEFSRERRGEEKHPNDEKKEEMNRGDMKVPSHDPSTDTLASGQTER